MRTTILPGVVLLCFVRLCTTSALASAVQMSLPNCSDKCGNIAVPYPFGMGPPGCSGNSSFHIICQNSTTPFLPSIGMEVLNISLEGTITVKSPVAPMNCTTAQKSVSIGKELKGTPFKISSESNTFAVLGCRNTVLFKANGTLVSGCSPICLSDYRNDTCDGINCCQTKIPLRSQELKYTYQSTQDGDDKGFCGYAFPVDKTWFPQGYGSYKGMSNNFSNPFDEQLVYAPLVLDWEFDGANMSKHADCSFAYDNRQHYFPRCRSTLFSIPRISPCYVYGSSSVEGSGDDWSETLRCSCLHGFEGNPYLHHGCVDIDECQQKNNPCKLVGERDNPCINEIGSYTCLSPKPDRSGIRARNITLITIGSVLGAGILVLGFIGAWKLVKFVVKRFNAHWRRICFKRNGGLLLEQKLSSSTNNNGYKKSKLFSSRELTQATDHYSESRVLGRGGQGTVYKGMLTDGSIVAVKKSKKVDESDVEFFINEVVILSQINHRNVVKLLGCCLETEIPLLVYEYIPNGTLFEHIHDPSEDFPLTWEMRLRIAAEVAGALSYLHSSASAPIFHRDIKSTNILLDEKYRAKISDFGTSRSVSIDQTHFTTRVFGTYGYLDPEYFQSNHFTEKSDVYSFGVVMVELLTGEKAVSLLRADMARNLATYFLQSMEEDKLLDIVDARVLVAGEGKRAEEIAKVAELSRRCLNLNGKLRPTMKEVANELESIIQVSRRPNVDEDCCDNGASEHTVVGPPIEFSDFSSILSITLER